MIEYELISFTPVIKLNWEEKPAASFALNWLQKNPKIFRNWSH